MSKKSATKKDRLLFIDDERDPAVVLKKSYGAAMASGFEVHVARSSEEAKRWVEENGFPEYMALDHDLGYEDTTPVFLKWLQERWLDGLEKDPSGFNIEPPEWTVHSQNPAGALAMDRFMVSWHSYWCKILTERGTL